MSGNDLQVSFEEPVYGEAMSHFYKGKKAKCMQSLHNFILPHIKVLLVL